VPETREGPPRVSPDNDNGYLEELTKAIFRAGFSWKVIEQKWDNFRKGFDGFDVPRVATYGPEDITRLFNDESIVRNRRKILATVDNAQTMLELASEHGSFCGYLRSLDNLDYAQRAKVLTGRFKGLGRTGTFVFLYCVNEEIPDWHQR
tara:strand:- start:428 stop:874 length:447 start_codon:yes stop_codon:yes gene_type:complete